MATTENLSEEWELLTTFTFPQESYVFMSVLESEGIPTKLLDSNIAQTGYSVAAGGAKLMVRAGDYERACKLMNEQGYHLEEVDDNVYLLPKSSENGKCPFCGSTSIEKCKPKGLMGIVERMIGVFIPSFRSTYSCKNCGKKWQYV